MNINEQLANLYLSKWDELCKVLNDNGLFGYEYNPLLLNINDEDDFESADVRVMLIGQDMSDGNWYQYDRNADILTECMPACKTFDNKEGSILYPNGPKHSKGMGGGMNMFINMLNDRYRDKKIRYVWNDLIKIGRNTKYNDKRETLKEIEYKNFDVLRDEVQIIQPQVIVFMTGPTSYWESILQKRFGIKIDNYKELAQLNNIRQVAKIELNAIEYPFVQSVYRTYHPNAHNKYIASKNIRYKAIIDDIIL